MTRSPLVRPHHRIRHPKLNYSIAGTDSQPLRRLTRQPRPDIVTGDVHPKRRRLLTTLMTIETPERVAFTYDVAGLGTRVMAYLIDLAVRGAVLLLGMVAFFVIRERQGFGGVPSGILAAGVVAFFLLQWGYWTLFETFWNGQTPGKRVMGIRVIKEGGFPASLVDVALRNVVRVVDFLPLFYGIGVICMFLSKRHQRLGDIVSGTLVVRQTASRPPSLDEILAAHSQADTSRTRRQVRVPLSVLEFEAIVEFLERAEGLLPEARSRIAEKFAGPIGERIAESKSLRENIPADRLDAESLLKLVVHSRQSESDEEIGGDQPSAGGRTGR